MIETVELGVSGCCIQRLITFSAYSVYYFIVTSISLIFVMFYYNLLDLMYLYMNAADLDIKMNLQC